MSTSLDDLYRNDYYAWSRQQAAELRRLRAERVNTRLDLDNLAEEVESLGRSDLRRVKSQLRRIMEHLLKLHYSPAAEPRDGWLQSILEARQDIDDYLTPAMRPEIEADLDRDYAKARARAALALDRQGEVEAAAALPVEPPYRLSELLDPEWWPTASSNQGGEHS
jgi:hypothetical protein